MPDDALWYLIFTGGFGLVLVFVGCFVIPLVSCLLKWWYPPLTDEEQLQLNESKDPILQSLIHFLEKQAVPVSDIDWTASAAFEVTATNEPKEEVSDFEKDEATSASLLALRQQDEDDHRPPPRSDKHDVAHSSCAICLEEYYAPTNQVVCATGGCPHYFRKTCMQSLIRSRVLKGNYDVVPCPICRLPFFAPTSWNLQLTSSGSSSSSSTSGNNTSSTTIARISGTATNMIATEDAETGAALTAAASANVGSTSITNDHGTSTNASCDGETCSIENDILVPSSSLPIDVESASLPTTLPSNDRDSTSSISANLEEDLQADEDSSASVMEAPISRMKMSKRNNKQKKTHQGAMSASLQLRLEIER